MAFAALYDANVLFPHEVRDILMISTSTRQHLVHWSDDIIDEWTRNAIKRHVMTEKDLIRLQNIMNTMFPDVLINRSRYEKLISSMTNAEGDRHVSAAAVVVGADVVVTNNLKHFPKGSLEQFNIAAQSPDIFVRNQAALNPFRFRQIFLNRARERNKLSIARGHGTLSPEEIALFLRDGPVKMPETGKYILDLLKSGSSE